MRNDAVCDAEIVAGDVFISNNPRLCHVHTINWTDIMTDQQRFTVFVNNSDVSSERCQYHCCVLKARFH